MEAYERLRREVLARDLSGRAQFRLEGRDRVRFLHNLCTNDIQGLKPGAGCLAAIVQRTGKLAAAFKVRAHEEYFFIDADAALKDVLPEIVRRYAIMDDVQLKEASGNVVARYGPNAKAPDVPLYHFVKKGNTLIVKIPFGCEIFGGERAGDPGADEAWDVFRIESGVPEWGKELTGDVIPVEAGLDSAVSYSKGCYLGQEVLLRLKNFSEPKQLLKGVLLNRAVAPGPIPEGRVTSVCLSPSLGRHVALALLRKEFTAAATRIGIGIVTDLPLVKADF